MTFVKFIIIFVFIIAGNNAFAQEVKVYSLKESISEAIANNWALKAKAEKIEQAAQLKKQARAGFFPKISTSYAYTRLNETPIMRIGALPIPANSPYAGLSGMFDGLQAGSRKNFQWKGTITQPIFTGFALVSSYELAKLGIDSSIIEKEKEILDVALNVKNAYFGILQADKALDVAKKAVESLQSHVRVAKSHYDVGMTAVNEFLKAEVELANAMHRLIKATNGTRLARAYFNTVLSRDISSPVKVEDVRDFTPERGEFHDYLNKSLANRSVIKLLDIHIKQAGQQIRLAKSRLYPEVALNYDYIKEGDESDVSGSNYHDANRWQVVAFASWTIWEWGKRTAAIKEKKHFLRELINTRKALIDNISFELKDALLALDEAEENIPTTKKAVEQAEENLRVSQERYYAQMTTSTEVLDANTLLTQAKTNYYNSFYSHSLSTAKLKRILGTY